MKKTGDILKVAREKLGLTLVEVSMATKINPKVLAAMEAGDETTLPAKTFLRGFIRSYAAYLKLDVDAVLQTYQSELEGAIQKQSEAEPKVKESTTSSALPDIEARSRTMKAIAIAGIIVLIILILVVRSLVEKYEHESKIEPVATMSVSPSTAASIEVSEPVVVASVAPSVATLPAAAEPSTSPTPSPSPPPPKVVAVQPQPQTPPSPPPQPSPSALPSAKPEPSPKPSVAKKNDVENEIIIEALDKVTLKFQVNNGEITEVLLQPDQVHTIKAKGTVTIDASDGGAIDIIINGRDTGVPGDLGKPKKIKLP